MKTNFENYDIFTNYIMSKISLEERREIRKDWNLQYDKGEKCWQTYLLKKVNKK